MEPYILLLIACDPHYFSDDIISCILCIKHLRARLSLVPYKLSVVSISEEYLTNHATDNFIAELDLTKF